MAAWLSYSVTAAITFFAFAFGFANDPPLIPMELKTLENIDPHMFTREIVANLRKLMYPSDCGQA